MYVCILFQKMHTYRLEIAQTRIVENATDIRFEGGDVLCDVEHCERVVAAHCVGNALDPFVAHLVAAEVQLSERFVALQRLKQIFSKVYL